MTDARSAAAPSIPSITWVGHSTLLVQLDGLNDPDRSPLGRAREPADLGGAAADEPTGLAFDDLPRIDVVVISHDHYDHLDPRDRHSGSPRTHDPLFVVPLRLKAWFRDNGIRASKSSTGGTAHEYGGVEFVCVPAQHFSQRTLWDRDTRLWASWAVVGKSRRLYFGGDTGYFSGFKEIGRRLGPFDVAAIAIGAYKPPAIMRFVHTTPEQAVQAFEDLRAPRAAWHPLGHLRSRRGAPRRAAGPHARRSAPARDPPREPRLDPQGRARPGAGNAGQAARRNPG